jgi:Nucleotide-binding protein implicated in inhibition of septum formation
MLDNLEKYKIVLASNSPRRRELMTGLGVKYTVKTLPDIEELFPDGLAAEEIPVILLKEKRMPICI